MISRRQSIVLIMIVLCSYTQAELECPSQCHCTVDFSVVICRGMEIFPVFSFASKVKILDLTHGKIKHIHIKDVKAYSHLKKLFINHNPLDCNHVTIHMLKHLRETAGLESFDGHKIECPREPSVINNRPFDNNYHGHRHNIRPSGGAPLIYFVHGSFAQLVGGIVMMFLGMLTVAVVCCVLVRYRRKLSRKYEHQNLADVDPLSKMERGTGYKSDTTGKRGKKQQRGPQGYPENVKSDDSHLKGDDGLNRVVEKKGSNEKGTGDESDTAEHMLEAGLRKQRRSSQGYPKNVKSDDSLLAEEEDYLKKNMKKQRSASRGYALENQSSDEDSAMLEIDLNYNLIYWRTM